MTYLDMQIQSVRFITNPTATWVGNLLKIIEEFSFIPRPPSCSLASSSGPPFVPYSSGEGWDVMDTMSQIRLGSWWHFRDEFLRIPWDPLYQEDPLWWSWAIQQREGVDLSLPVPDLLLLGRVRLQNGLQLCWTFPQALQWNYPNVEI